MFGIFKHKLKTPNGSSNSNFLDKVDSAYQKAFDRQNPSFLEDYMTRRCLVLISEKIRHNKCSNAGVSRYRHVNWVKVASEPDCYVYRREVTYDDIRISYGIVVPVGDATTELWEIRNIDSKNLVSDIRGVDCE